MNYGIDIKINDGELALGYDDFELVAGKSCPIQDITTRLTTPKGALFYAPEFGSNLHRFIQVNVDELVILDFTNEIRSVVSEDPRVDRDSIEVNYDYGLNKGLSAKVLFRFIDSDIVENLVVNVEKELKVWG